MLAMIVECGSADATEVEEPMVVLDDRPYQQRQQRLQQQVPRKDMIQR
jgi:hypothetical protein